ncbi:hypothetical protein FN846DRAFT_52168 [Sphaerosporella brunnea]|uniref:Uncharacterized protein n=1 Tax=Sphaerosporella brunnea TaxID=1250544 RepID=A0A5J5EVM2_9PEZI|nr:hypothetical protein FN846DRAFT_52168 [Sphaerosporella brunnea]
MPPKAPPLFHSNTPTQTPQPQSRKRFIPGDGFTEQERKKRTTSSASTSPPPSSALTAPAPAPATPKPRSAKQRFVPGDGFTREERGIRIAASPPYLPRDGRKKTPQPRSGFVPESPSGGSPVGSTPSAPSVRTKRIPELIQSMEMEWRMMGKPSILDSNPIEDPDDFPPPKPRRPPPPSRKAEKRKAVSGTAGSPPFTPPPVSSQFPAFLQEETSPLGSNPIEDSDGFSPFPSPKPRPPPQKVGKKKAVAGSVDPSPFTTPSASSTRMKRIPELIQSMEMEWRMKGKPSILDSNPIEDPDNFPSLPPGAPPQPSTPRRRKLPFTEAPYLEPPTAAGGIPLSAQLQKLLHPTPNIVNTADPQQPLLDWSPSKHRHGRNSKYVHQGLAATVAGWVLDVKHSLKKETVFELVVGEVRSEGVHVAVFPLPEEGKEMVGWLLVRDSRVLVSGVKVRVQWPWWTITLGDRKWMVGVFWEVVAEAR